MRTSGILSIILKNDIDALSHALDSGFDPNGEPSDEEGTLFSPLSQAIFKKSWECAEMLVRAGAKDPGPECDHKYVWLISEAAFHGQYNLVKAMLDAGREDIPEYNESNALICAAMQGHADVLRLLIKSADRYSDDWIYY